MKYSTEKKKKEFYFRIKRLNTIRGLPPETNGGAGK